MERFDGEIQKSRVWSVFRHRYKMELNEDQLDLINEIYYKARKESAKDMVLYRLVNVAFGVILFIIWLFILGTTVEKYFYLCVSLLYVVYNAIHGLKSKVKYRSIKRKDFSNE